MDVSKHASGRTGLIAFAIAVALYGLFSSPSPDRPGIIEFFIVLALIAASICGGLTLRENWTRPLLALLAYGTTVPFIIGMISGAGAGDMLRDGVAFYALALPILLAGLFTRDARPLLYALLFIGLAFSIRYLLSPDMVLMSLLNGPFDDRLLYLANSPLVMFTATWLLLRGCFVEQKPVRIIACVLIALIPIAAMAGMMQRATIALLALAFATGFIITIIRKPQRALIIALIASAIIIAAWPFVSMLVSSLIAKTLNVGWNARAEEWSAIFDVLGQNPVTAIFGTGWGALIRSPAVGDQWVRFSHSLISSMLWKAGWVGVILCTTAIATLILTAYRRLNGDLVTFASLICALIPACFLYGSYKSLCFGILLLAFARLELDKPPVAMVTKPTP